MIAKKIALGFAIAFVFPMLIHYGVSTFVHRPKWEDYQVAGLYDPDVSPPEKSQRRAEQEQKEKARKVAEKHFEQYLFAFAVPFGLIALLVGAFLRLPALGSGLMLGGIFSICDGYGNYWSELADALKFISLVVAFVLLVFLGYRRLERTEI